jgi:hypothetical protein
VNNDLVSAAGAADERERTLSVIRIVAFERSSVGRTLAMRPGFSAHALMPPTVQTCAMRREAWVSGFDCVAGAVLVRALPIGYARWPRPDLIERVWVQALFPARAANKKGEA